VSGFIHATLPWADAERRPYENGNHGRYQLTEKDLLCFDCPLPECDQSDPRCPFNAGNITKRDRRIEKRVCRLRKKWERELDEAVARIMAEREAG